MKKTLRSLLLIAALIFSKSPSLFAQVTINEISSNNQSYPDNDGEYKDWIELYNSSASPVNLLNYKLSDSIGWPSRWAFPNVSIPANGYLTVFASGKNRVDMVNHWETAVKENDTWKYIIPSAAITGWTASAFNDAAWLSGPGGFGYGDSDDGTTLATGTVSVYTRKSFSVADSAAINSMILSMDCDDGFVAYLNGVEIARNNMASGTPAYNATASSSLEAVMYSGGTPTAYAISPAIFKPLLKNGVNVLAIEIHNDASTSSDMSGRPFLHFGIKNASINYQTIPAWFVAPATATYIHTNFSISSSIGETITLADASNVIINTIAVPALAMNNTYGRYPNGSATIKVLTPGTPNASNGTSTAYNGYLNATVSFSIPAGFYSGTQTVTCTCSDASAQIRYTTDGDKPTNGGTIYSGPISVSSSRVLRAMCIKSGYISKNIETNTYFINDPGVTIPVISISTRPNNFFSNDSGIYVLGPNAESAAPHRGANFWMDWEKEVHIEYFDKTKAQKLEQDCGIKIFGGWSRDNAMKSMRLVADEDKYGKDKFKYAFFSEKPKVDEFSGIHLRCGGNDFNYTHLRDQTNHRVIQSLPAVIGGKTNIDFSAYEPIAVFINGQYWGVHHLRERYNTGYFEGNFNEKNVDLLEFDGDVVDADNNAHFMNMINFIQANDMTQTSNYNQVKQWLDIENYADYIIAETYHCNWDWIHNNIKYWRPKTATGKWRYLYYDTDFSFGLFSFNSPTTNELNRVITDTKSIHSPMLQKMLTNIEFRNYFANRYADLINTIYQASNYSGVFNALKTELTPEMSRHFTKWPQNAGSVTGWNNECNNVTSFITARASNARNHIQSQFSLTKQVNVTLAVSPAGAGVVKINSVTPASLPWTGVYFDGVPVTITVAANPGYTFANWTSSAVTVSSPTSKSITLNVNANNTFTANFNTTTNIPKITFSEINYNSDSSLNPGNWIELYNYGNASQDLSGWIFKDEHDYNSFVIPNGTTLAAGQRLVLVEEAAKFIAKFPTVTNYIGSFGFDFSNNGGTLRLFDNANRLYLSVTYDNKAPWPTYANGKGGTLELTDPTKNLSDGTNWYDGCRGGSPGKGYVSCPCAAVDLGADKSLCLIGGSYTMNGGVTAHPNRKFTWYLNGTKITGVTTPTLTVSSGGDYKLVVDSLGCVKSDVITLTTDLAFTLGPDVVLCDPITAVLDSKLSAATGNFSWKKNGTTITGQAGPTLTVTAPGTYILYASSPTCTQKSDTVIVTSVVTPTDGARCGTGTVPLSVSGPGSYTWYTASSGGSVAATATSTYNTPSLSTTTTYYVEDASFFNGTVGPLNPTVVAGTSGNTWSNSDWNSGYKLIFDVLKPLYLDAVTVWAKTPQTITVRVLQPDKTTVKFTKTVTVSAAGQNRIPLGFKFTSTDVKNGYYLDFVGTTGMLMMNGDGSTPTYPYTATGAMRITGTDPSWASAQGWFFYAYNWEFSSGPGPCKRVPVTATINNTPAAAGTISGSTNVCSGTSGTYSIAPINYATSYNWTIPSGASITSGANTNSITVLFGTSSGSISVAPVSTCGTGGSNSLTVTVSPSGGSATVTASANITSICTGQTVNFSSTSTNGGGSPTYQWKKNGVNISNATNTTYSTSTITNGDAFSITMTSSSGCVTNSPVTSSNVAITVSSSVTPTVSASASSTTICTGASVTFTASQTNGGTTPAYQWKKNGTDISGATLSSYTSTSLVNNDVITVQMTSNANCPSVNPVTSTPITMAVNANLPASVSITGNPITICTGGTVNFTATPVNGGPAPAYQWKKNGVDISAATLATYSSSALVNSDAITVVMTSNSGCATGSPATSNSVAVTVNPILPASVSFSASATTICPGQSVTFTASPTNGGTAPVYQWKVDGVNAGTNSNIFTSTALANNNVVTVIMTSNAACVSGSPAASAPVTMTVNPAAPASVSITSSASTICSGQSVTFTAAPVNGGTTPTYLWKVDGVSAGTNSNIFTSTTLSNNNVVTVVMTSNATCASGSPATSNPLTMTVNPATPASVSIVSSATAICAGQSVSFNATPVNAGSSPVYQWKINGVAAGTNSSSFATTSLANGDIVSLSMTSNATCATGSPAISNNVTMTVNAYPSAIITPAGATTICSGNTLVLAGNTGAGLSYLWKNNSAIISGATAANYTASASGSYTVDVTSNGCTTTSAVQPVTVVAQPTVSNAGGDQSVCSSTATLAGNTPTTGTGTWSLISGTGVITSSSVSNSTVTGLGIGSNVFEWKISNGTTCPVSTDQVTITVTTSAVAAVNINASANPACLGNLVTFNAVPQNGGSAPVYQWKLNGNIVGTNSSTYTSSSLVNSDVLTVQMTSNLGCATGSPATSNSISMTVNPNVAASVSVTASATSICSGQPVTFTAAPGNGGTTPSYQWKINGNNVGAGGSSFVTSSISNNDVVTVSMTSALACAIGSPATSTGVTMTVNSNTTPSVSISASGNNVCQGSPITFTAAPLNGGTAPTYQWSVNNTNVTNVGNVYTTSSLNNGDAVKVVMTSNASCISTTTATSNSVSVNVNANSPVSVSVSSDLTKICEGSAVTFTAAPVNGGSTPSYQWKVNNVNAGTNSNVFAPTNLTDGSNVTVVLTSNKPCITGSPATSTGIAIVVDSKPTIANAGPDQSIANNTTTMAGNSPVVGAGLWTQTSGSGFINTSNDPATQIGGLSNGANVYRWEIKNGICPSSFDDVIITVGSVAVFEITGPDVVEAGNTYTFTVPNEQNASYIWTAPNGATIIGNGTNTVTITFGSNVNGTINVTKTSSSGTLSASKDVHSTATPVIGAANTDYYSLYPNPFIKDTRFTITSTSTEQLLIRVIDMKGVGVYESKEYSTNEEIVLGKELSSGMYNVTAIYSDKIIQFKIYKAE